MTRSSSALWVSGVLAAAVLGVFYTHQWNGPIGTLQHFIAAIRLGDQATLDRLAYPPGVGVAGGGPPAYAHALKIEMEPVTPPGRLMTIRVSAYVPTTEGLQWGVAFWVMVKTPDGWRVHIPLTNAANMRLGQ